MPPPNTPEEFFEEEYQQRRNEAASTSRRWRFNLPPHNEDLAESVADHEAARNAARSTAHSRSRSRSRSSSWSSRNDSAGRHDNSRPRSTSRLGRHDPVVPLSQPVSASRRYVLEHSHSRSSSRSHSPSRPRRRGRDELLGRSSSPSTIGPLQVDYDADYDVDYANYLRNPEAFAAAEPDSGQQSSTPSQSGGAPTIDMGANSANVANASYALSRSEADQQRQQDRRVLPTTAPEHQTQAVQTSPTPTHQAQTPLAPQQQSSQLGLQVHEGLTAAAPSPSALSRNLVVPVPHLKRAKTPKLDWHALEYIGAYDENLDCPICRSPLVQPEITTCFHIFCHKCLVQSLEHGNRCPIDRNPIQFFETSRGRVPARPAPHIIANQLDNLQVRCPNARCDYVCARSLIEHHYRSDCAFTKIPCPDTTCTKLVTRRDSEEGSCLHKAVDCVYCGKPVELAALDDHYDVDCNQKELMCEHCLAAVPRHRHGTHVANCAERRVECKYRSSGCTYTNKKKDFSDHESTCLYGMIQRMNRAHRADMNSMETVLQDSQDRVRKLEADMAAMPSRGAATAANAPVIQTQTQPHPHAQVSSGHPQFFDFIHQPRPPLDSSHDLSSYYDAAAAADDALAHGGGGGGGGSSTRPGTPPAGGLLAPTHQTAGGGGSVAVTTSGNTAATDDDDRMNRIIAYIDIFDAKVENLERYLGEVDARQAQLFMNELGPLKDQILELRNSMGHISMYVRWLMESFRQTTKRSVGLHSGGGVAGVAGASTNAGGDEDGAGVGAAATATATATASAGAASRRPSNGLRGSMGGTAMPMRRMSDRENPPRL